MIIKKFFLYFALLILRNIPIFFIRKKFSKLIGPYFDGIVGKTAYGFPMISKLHDSMNRIGFEGSYGVVAEFITDIPTNSMYIDIGANQGFTCILADYALNKKGKKLEILALEPSPSIYSLMKKNINLNKCNKIKTFNQAISATYDQLYLDENNLSNSGASHISSKGTKVMASPLTLEDIKIYGLHENIYIKIDTEGYELSVLEGIRELLEAKLVRKMIIEIDDRHLKKYGNSISDVYNYCNKYNFKPKFGLKKSGHYDEIFVEK